MAGRITWEDDIKYFFTQMDVGCMRARGTVDLSDYASVKKMGQSILRELNLRADDPDSGKGMPRGDRPWPREKIDTFDAWLKDGAPEKQDSPGPPPP